MKKVFIFLIVILSLFSGCSKEPENEITLEPSDFEESKYVREEITQEPAESVSEKEYSEPASEKAEQIDYYWEEFIEKMKTNGYTREEIESLETYGFTREEIKAMTWVDVVRGLGMIRFGFEREEVESALEILKNKDLRDETFVSVDDSTIRIELIEDFIAAVEKDKAAFVRGTGVSEPLYYYFELSYEPGGMIEYSMISEHLVSKSEFYEIYDTEVFYRFKNEEESLTFPKIELWPGERLGFSSEQDVPGMPITLCRAKEIAEETMLSGYRHPETAEEFLNSLKPKCDGIFDIGGRPYYRIGFYQGESPNGGTYYVCADESEVVFCSSEIDGRLMPIASSAKPKVDLRNG